MGMRLLVCGSRDYKDRKRIREYLLKLKPDVVIEGGASGADLIAYEEASKIGGIRVESYQPNWRKHGKGAGMRRNKAMIIEGKPDYCLAFFSGKPSKGTMHTVELCKAAGIDGRTIGLKREQISPSPLTIPEIQKDYKEYLNLQHLGIWESFQAYRKDPDVYASIEFYYNELYNNESREES